MLAIAAAMALLLGLVGIYAVVSYAVAQRTREIGIRAALGARPDQLKRMFIGHGLLIAGAGVASGILASLVLMRFMTALLFGVVPLDRPTYAAVAVVLMMAAAVASYIPAHRAARVDPLVALRYE